MKTNTVLFTLFFLLPGLIFAQQGPGLGNLTYNQNELFTSIWRYTEVNHYGSNIAILHNGYLVTTFTPDSGRPPGGILIWDVSDPRNPVLVKRIYDQRTASLREAHAISAHGNYILLQDGCGFQIWDLSDVNNPVQVKRFCIPGYDHHDYGSSWQMFWQAPYVFIGNGAAGFDVVDASDINNPVLVKHVNTGLQAGPIFAVGNLLITTAHDIGAGMSVFDISDPRNPQLVNTYTATERMYAGFVNGNRIITSARGNANNATFSVYDFSDPTNIVKGGTINIGNSGEQLYNATQDQYIFQGVQHEIVKIDASDPANMTVAGRGTLGIIGDSDHGQVSPFGNLIFVGNDHGTGSGFVVHQTAPDTKGPEPNMIVPHPNSVNRALTSRIGLTFTDCIDLTSVNNQTFIVRLKGSNQALTGKYSHQFSIVNFSPDSPLQPNSTYEVVIPAGGIKDYAGNTVEETFISYFSTGPTGEFPPVQPGNVLIFEEDERISLFWNSSGNTSEYYVKRSHSASGPFVTVDTTTGTNFTDEDVENNTIYYYTVVARNNYGESNPSRPVKGIPALYVTDLNWSSAVNEWGPAETDQSNGEQLSNDGRTITLNGVKYSRGLGVHGHSEIVYQLDGAYRRFVSDIGLDDEVGSSGLVTFEVWGDGTRLYASGQMTGTSATATVDVDVSGIQQLRLVVTDEGDAGMDHASWGGARLIPLTIPNLIPGTIQAENYDNGGNGTAYQDTETDNLGGAYRNEAVDIETCSEGGYSIGYTSPGEWIKYTATAETAGEYHLKLRVATVHDDQELYLEIDGVNATGALAIPNTGGWQTWEDLYAYNIPLTQGEHTLRLVFLTGNVNVNYMQFSLAPQLITPYVQVSGGAWENTGSVVLCGETESLTFGPQPMDGSWTWAGPNGFSASTREVSLQQVTAADAGTYTATYSCGAGCSDSYDFTVTVDVCTGTTGISDSRLEIYPNPVTDQIRIQCTSTVSEISISDVRGKTVFRSQEEFSGSRSVPVKGVLEKGVYFIRVRDTGGMHTRKIVVQ